ncbi:MAG TPA: carboxymuconolactone decarboxylase family protein [Solirubrobacterales bacterium]|nr:carboxymuconolactone decarboxylase family protein [Solirubrobacterales bacterium]
MEGGSQPRIRPGTRAQVGALNAAILRVIGLGVGGRAPNVFTTLARHRGLFRRWLLFAGALMPGGKLPRRDSELVILRVADRTGSEYEWAQHERLGRAAGLSVEEIARVREGAAAPGWSERQALLLAAVDELYGGDRVEAETWDGLARHLSEVELIELCMLTGHYVMLAGALNSLQVETDPIAEKPRLRWLSRR